MCFLGIKIFKSLLIGLTAGIIISIFLQKVPVLKIFSYILFGYKGGTTSSQLNKILVGGGIQSIVSIFLIIMMAVALSSIFKGTDLINPMINKIISKVKYKGEIIVKTGIISAILTIICDQSMGLIIPGGLLRDKYKKFKIESYVLARTISDTGIVVAPLIPWNGNSLFILALTGISSIKYGPYALLCYVLPIVTLYLEFFTKKYS
ncbi:Na+/H+ antiporter NhaC family protein [Clostridium sp. WILCCON 0269]|uniref:Na+/H+ antiporter NhaC family protein n=1 Tax=Candidatus Clostridium eludens TaxID=3381663 RepID=A0ABW8SN20_9CLOT